MVMAEDIDECIFDESIKQLQMDTRETIMFHKHTKNFTSDDWMNEFEYWNRDISRRKYSECRHLTVDIANKLVACSLSAQTLFPACTVHSLTCNP